MVRARLLYYWGFPTGSCIDPWITGSRGLPSRRAAGTQSHTPA